MSKPKDPKDKAKKTPLPYPGGENSPTASDTYPGFGPTPEPQWVIEGTVAADHERSGGFSSLFAFSAHRANRKSVFCSRCGRVVPLRDGIGADSRGVYCERCRRFDSTAASD